MQSKCVMEWCSDSSKLALFCCCSFLKCCFVFEEYRILGKKGEGTFSEVLKVQDIQDGTYFACKKMKQRYERYDRGQSSSYSYDILLVFVDGCG